MAGLRGNQAYLIGGEQTAKGAPVAAADFEFLTPLTGGNIQPTREIGQLSETDSQRDVGVNYVESVGASGAPEIYVRDALFHRVLKWALGAMATSGTTNYTHTITPADALPYI